MANHNTSCEDMVTLDSVWMNMVRGIAISAVVIHHWLLFLPHQSSISIFHTVAELIQALAGTVVHLFFILSGCGLTVSYFRRGDFSWRQEKHRENLGSALDLRHNTIGVTTPLGSEYQEEVKQKISLF